MVLMIVNQKWALPCSGSGIDSGRGISSQNPGGGGAQLEITPALFLRFLPTGSGMSLKCLSCGGEGGGGIVSTLIGDGGGILCGIMGSGGGILMSGAGGWECWGDVLCKVCSAAAIFWNWTLLRRLGGGMGGTKGTWGGRFWGWEVGIGAVRPAACIWISLVVNGVAGGGALLRTSCGMGAITIGVKSCIWGMNCTTPGGGSSSFILASRGGLFGERSREFDPLLRLSKKKKIIIIMVRRKNEVIWGVKEQIYHFKLYLLLTVTNIMAKVKRYLPAKSWSKWLLQSYVQLHSLEMHNNVTKNKPSNTEQKLYLGKRLNAMEPMILWILQ